MQNNIIDACIRYNVKKVLFLGSSCIFPVNFKQPLKEEYLMKGDLEPTNYGYALAKITGLKLCEYANKQFNTRFISLMPCNLYGENDCFDLEKSHVLSALINKIYNAKLNNLDVVEVWGTGNQRREFMYVTDLVDCMLWSMNNLEKTDTFLNVGVGEDITIRDLAGLIKDVVGYSGDFYFNIDMPDGMKQKLLDVSKINVLGWNYKTSLRDGIEKTVEWYVEQLKIG
jgi:GDP-L-fucose synthase